MLYQDQPLHYEKRAVQLKKKALEPQEKFCKILGKKVTVLVEYLDYISQSNKGEKGAIYCENIIDCYHYNVKCRYSGISPLYSDPFESDIEPEIS